MQVPGFRVAAVHAGLKAEGAADLALIVSDAPCSAAAAFTRNRVQAAPVLYDRGVLERARSTVRAVVINAKYANAVTGEQGLRDAERMAAVTAEALQLPSDSGVMVMSTGVIGVPLPMDRIESGIRQAAQHLGHDTESAARAIMTTDTRPKTASRELLIGDHATHLTGIAKGAGMIHPDMATMLGVVVTDASIGATALQAAVDYVVERSFNCISVDGDTSTNDTFLVLANGGGRPLEAHGIAFSVFQQALLNVAQDLARQIAFDGEGATKRVTVNVREAGSFEAARQVARTIATSPLVKTALFACDANWGRVLAAAGRAGVVFDPSRAGLRFGPLQVLHNGEPVAFDEAEAATLLAARDIEVDLTLGLEPGEATVWTCDLSHEYVVINGRYRT